MAITVIVKQMGWKNKKLGYQEVFPSCMKDELLQAEKDGLIAIINLDKEFKEEFFEDEED